MIAFLKGLLRINRKKQKETKKDRIMVDLETLGTGPGCIILSIGAISFDPETNSTGRHFYMVINTESCLAYGLAVNPETLHWWEQQNHEAQEVLRQANDYKTSVSIKFALNEFNKFISQHRDPEVWGNGADFDNTILAYAMTKCDLVPNWKFWNNRCFRTLKNMFPSVKMNRIGTYHNSLDDAETQAQHANILLKKLSGVEA
ncbi:3'-5' exonuclease [Undibacterium sp. SXout20W]|uniref:3'-5' exonuclease n=1 Tax=Undibacterium sp. SXout20W TaxID=3413051 RepID=UPI003BF292D8